MFLSTDGQWLAAVNCFGDIYIFNLEVRRYAPVWYSRIHLFLLPAIDIKAIHLSVGMKMVGND
jgi:hypothetical protein